LQPDALKARNMPVHELLVAASDKILHDLTDTPAVRMEVMNTVAHLLIDINEFDRASLLSRESVKIARESHLTHTDAYIESLIGVAFAGRLLGRGQEAGDARDEALRILDARNDRTSLLRARAMGTTIAQFSADPGREIELMTAAVELFKARYPNDPGHFNSVFALGQLHRTQGDMHAALEYFQAASEVFQSSGLQAYSDLGSSYAWAAFCEMQLGWVDDALRDYEKGIQLLRQHAGDVSIYTRIHLGLYGQALHQAGKLEQAHEYFDLVLKPEHIANPTAVEFDTAVYKALGLLQQGQARQALQVLDPYRQRAIVFGTRFVPNGVQFFAVRARALASQGKVAAAKAELARVAELPQFYGTPAQKSDCYLAAVIAVALADNDLPTARAALAQHGPLEPPKEFDLDYLQLATDSAYLKRRMGDLRGAIEVTDAALAHLQAHAGNSNFGFMRRELQRARDGARPGGEQVFPSER
jgi:tetratricopeptide (TPR) repeat protein